MQELLLGVLLLLAVAWLIVRIRSNKQDTSTSSASTKKRKTSAFHAVSIKYSENACDAAKAMTGRRFLATAAPRLPLPECDSLECRCKFAHHDDRRTGRDRRSPFAAKHYAGDGTGSHEKERREKQDRRKSERDLDLEL